MLYCPNCTKECVIRDNKDLPSSWNNKINYWCDDCGIIIYSDKLLLDSPDLEKSKEYKTRQVIWKVIGNEKIIDYLAKYLTIK